MSLAGKVFAVISFVLAIFYVGITSALVSLQENYKAQYKTEVASHNTTKQQAEEDRKLAADTEKRLSAERDDLRQKLTSSIAQNQLLEGEWVSSEKALRVANSVIKDQGDQIERQQARLDRALKDLAARGTDIEGLREKITSLEGELVALGKARDELNDKLVTREKELANAVKELERVVGEFTHANDILAKLKNVYPDIYQEMITTERDKVVTKKVIRGKATAVDAKLGLVVINAGQRQGVTKGITFIVFRGDKYVGKVVVDEIFPDVSACRYEKEAMQADVEVGDDVTTKLAVDF